MHDPVVNLPSTPRIKALAGTEHSQPAKSLWEVAKHSLHVMLEPVSYNDRLWKALKEFPQCVKLSAVNLVPRVCLVVDGAVRHLEKLSPEDSCIDRRNAAIAHLQNARSHHTAVTSAFGLIELDADEVVRRRRLRIADDVDEVGDLRVDRFARAFFDRVARDAIVYFLGAVGIQKLRLSLAQTFAAIHEIGLMPSIDVAIRNERPRGKIYARTELAQAPDAFSTTGARVLEGLGLVEDETIERPRPELDALLFAFPHNSAGPLHSNELGLKPLDVVAADGVDIGVGRKGGISLLRRSHNARYSEAV